MKKDKNAVVFWDFDGTLVYSRHLWSGTLLRTLERYTENNAVTMEMIRPYMAHGFSWDTPNADFVPLKGEKWWKFTDNHIRRVYRAVGMSADETERLIPLFHKTLFEKEHYHLYDDTLSTLESLSERGVRHFVLSNNYPELDDTIEALGIDKYFDGTVISARVGYDKPRREIFEYAYELAGKPEKCVMVGDNPASDIAGAESFGIPSVLVHRNGVSLSEAVSPIIAALLR